MPDPFFMIKIELTVDGLLSNRIGKRNQRKVTTVSNYYKYDLIRGDP